MLPFPAITPPREKKVTDPLKERRKAWNALSRFPCKTQLHLPVPAAADIVYNTRSSVPTFNNFLKAHSEMFGDASKTCIADPPPLRNYTNNARVTTVHFELPLKIHHHHQQQQQQPSSQTPPTEAKEVPSVAAPNILFQQSIPIDPLQLLQMFAYDTEPLTSADFRQLLVVNEITVERAAHLNGPVGCKTAVQFVTPKHRCFKATTNPDERKEWFHNSNFVFVPSKKSDAVMVAVRAPLIIEDTDDVERRSTSLAVSCSPQRPVDPTACALASPAQCLFSGPPFCNSLYFDNVVIAHETDAFLVRVPMQVPFVHETTPEQFVLRHPNVLSKHHFDHFLEHFARINPDTNAPIFSDLRSTYDSTLQRTIYTDYNLSTIVQTARTYVEDTDNIMSFESSSLSSQCVIPAFEVTIYGPSAGWAKYKGTPKSHAATLRISLTFHFTQIPVGNYYEK